jgi:hypothetical protein
MKKAGWILGCVAIWCFAACQKELSENSGNFTAYAGHPLNDTAWAPSFSSAASVNTLVQLLKPAIVIDSFDASKDTTLSFGDSLSLYFKAGTCTEAGGAAAAGILKLEIFRLQNKGDYIKAFKPTTSNGFLLESAGAFFIRVTKDGRELLLSPGAVLRISFSGNTEPKQNMQVFNGQEGNPVPLSGIDTFFDWMRDSDTSWIRVFQKTSGTGGATIKGYEMNVKKLRWVSAERYTDSTKPKTKIFAILPPNYTNKNTAVFAVFMNQTTIVSLKADYPSRTFAAANIPLGTKLKILTISRIGDDTYLGIKDVNDVGTNTFYSITPEKKPLKDIVGVLEGL